MLNRVIYTVAASFGLASASAAEPAVAIGSAKIAPPTGWRETKKDDERVVFRSSDDRQQATVSLMRFGVVPSFEDFQRLCTLRIQGEKKDAPEAFIEPNVSACAFGADASLPSFSDRLGQPPELSLSEALKSSRSPLFGEMSGARMSPTRSASGTVAQRYVSRMPVLMPSRECDPKMVVVPSDPAVDYKMHVKVPDVEVVR